MGNILQISFMYKEISKPTYTSEFLNGCQCCAEIVNL